MSKLNLSYPQLMGSVSPWIKSLTGSATFEKLKQKIAEGKADEIIARQTEEEELAKIIEQKKLDITADTARSEMLQQEKILQEQKQQSIMKILPFAVGGIALLLILKGRNQ